MKSAAGTVRGIDQPAVVNLNVVGDADALALAARRLGAEFAAFPRFGVRARWDGELICRRNEIGDLVYRKWIADVPNAHARIEPRKHRDLAVIRRIERFSGRVCAEAPASSTVVALGLLHAER